MTKGDFRILLFILALIASAGLLTGAFTSDEVKPTESLTTTSD